MTAPHHRLSCLAVQPHPRLPHRLRCQLAHEGPAHVQRDPTNRPIHWPCILCAEARAQARQEVVRGSHMASGTGGRGMVPRARNRRYGGLGTSTGRVPGGWLRWTGCPAACQASRDISGKRHLEQAQGYIATSPENSRAGGGDIHTNSLAFITERSVRMET